MISENLTFSLVPHVSALLQIREGLGMTRKEIADELGIDSDTVGKWERSKSNVQLTIAQIKSFDALLKRLNLNWHDLPNHLGDPNVPPPKDTRRTKYNK